MSFQKRQEEVPNPNAPATRAQMDDMLYFTETTDFWVAFQVTVGTAAVQLPARHQPTKGALVKALSTNTGIVYVGHDINVTAANGFELTANQSIELEVESTDDIYVIGSAAGQVVCVAAL